MSGGMHYYNRCAFPLASMFLQHMVPQIVASGSTIWTAGALIWLQLQMYCVRVAFDDAAMVTCVWAVFACERFNPISCSGNLNTLNLTWASVLTLFISIFRLFSPSITWYSQQFTTVVLSWRPFSRWCRCRRSHITSGWRLIFYIHVMIRLSLYDIY